MIEGFSDDRISRWARDFWRVLAINRGFRGHSRDECKSDSHPAKECGGDVSAKLERSPLVRHPLEIWRFSIGS